MNNLFDSLRRKNLFGGLFQPSSTEPTNNPAIDDKFNINLNQQDTPALDNYRNLISSMPQREDYKTSKLGKVLAGIAGFSTLDSGAAFNTTRNLIDAPYNRAMTGFKSKADQYGALADIEEKTNKNKFDTTIKLNAANLDWKKEARAKQMDEKQIANIESEIKNRGLSIEKNETNGELEVVNKTNGQRSSLGKFSESANEKSTRKIDEAQKESNITQKRELNLIGPRSKAQMAEHSSNRLFDIKNPLIDRRIIDNKAKGESYSIDLNHPNEPRIELGQTDITPEHKAELTKGANGMTGISSSQQSDADKLAAQRVYNKLQGDKEWSTKWSKFFDNGAMAKPTTNKLNFMGEDQSTIDANWNLLQNKIKEESDNIQKAYKGGGPLKAKELTPDEEAVAFFKSKNEKYTPEDIAWLKTQPKPW